MPDDLQSRLAEFMGNQPDPNNDLNLDGRLRDFMAPLAQQQRRQQDALDEQYTKVPFDAPPEHRPYYTLMQAQQRQAAETQRDPGRTDPVGRYAVQALPLGSLLGRSARKKYEAAGERYQANEYGDDYEAQIKREADARIIAGYEEDQKLQGQFQRERPLASTAASVQGTLHEALIGGGLTQAAAPGFAAARTGTGLVPRLALGGAELATRTATMPSLYAQGESKSDTVNFVRGMVLTKILGSLGQQAEPLAGQVPTALGRRLGGAAIGAVAFPAEQQVADTATSLMDEALPDALQFKTKYGTLGALLRKDEGAERGLAMEALTGAVFAAMRAPKDTRKKVFETELKRQIEATPESGAGSAGSAGENATTQTTETPVQSPTAAQAEPAPSGPSIIPREGEIAPPRAANAFSDLGKPDVTPDVTPPASLERPSSVPRASLDVLRAKQKPIEAKPQPARNGLRSLFPELPAEVEQPPEFDKGEAFNPVRDFTERFLPQSGASEQDQAIAKRLAEGDTVRTVAADAGVPVETARQIGAKLAKQFNSKYESARQIFNEFSGSPGELQAKAERTTPEDFGRSAPGMGAAGGGPEEPPPPTGAPPAGTVAPEPPQEPAKPSSWFTKANDWIKSFAQQQFPATHRLDRETGESLSRAANADTAAKAGWNYFSNLLKVGGKPMSKWTDAEDRAAGAAWLERRARHERARLDAAGEDSSGIPTFVGVEGSPLRTEADYRAAQEGMWSFFEQAKQDWTPEVEKNFRGLKGLDPSDEINSPTQIPQLPLNMIGLSEADPSRGVVRAASRGLAGQQINRPGFAKKTTFTAEAYDLSLRNMMKRTLELGVPAARRAEFVRQAIDAGLIKDVSKGQRKPEGFVYLGLDPAAGLGLDPNAKYYVHPDAYRDVVRGLNIGERPGNVVADLLRRPAGVLYNIALLQPAEIASHIGNHLMALFAEGMGVPGWNLKDSLAYGLKVWRSDPEALRRVKNLAEISAGFEHEAKPGLVENLAGIAQDLGAPPLGEKGKLVAKYEPTALLGKFTSAFIDTMQKAVRLQLEDAYNRLSKTGNPKFPDTPQAKADFINKNAGNYNSKSSNAVVQFLKDSGLQSFATAAATFTSRSANRAFLGLGPLGAKPVSTQAAIQLRATQFAKMIPLLALGPVLNKIFWDDWFPDDVPRFAIKTGEKDYWDPLKPAGVRRGWRTLGINSTIEGLRHEKSGGEIAAGAADDVIQAGEHVLGGPPLQSAHTMATGRDDMGRQVAAKEDLPGRLLAGAKGLNPIPDLAAGQDQTGRPKTTAEGLKRFLKPFGFGTSKGPGATALADTYEMKKQYLAKTGRAEQGAPQPSAIAPLRDAALADDLDQFKKAWQAYKARARAAGKDGDRFDQDLDMSLAHLDPLASLSEDDRGRFYHSLTPKQQAKLEAAREYAGKVRGKIETMIGRAR